MVRGVWLLLGMLVAVIGFGLAAAALPSAAYAAPNVVVVLTDDQRSDTLSAMPTVQRELAGKGVKFTNALVTNPVCCPSRVSFLTGKYSKTTRIYSNPAMPRFDDRSTLATWLDDAGYETGLFGKYLIGYKGTYIPPGWDQWTAFSPRASYYDYTLNVNGTLQQHGSLESEYSTDLLADRAEAFIRSTQADTPVFLYFTPFAPHGRVGNSREATPAPRHAGSFAPPAIEHWRPPSYNEFDVSDKPRWVQNLPLISPERQARGDLFRQTQLESLQAVDEAVGRIIDALDDTGRLDDTIFLYTSDNGHLWGEHRWFHKEVAYEESIRVPLVVRYDPLTSDARSDGHLVANVDLAQTITDLVGVDAPGAEGRSLRPILERRGVRWRSQLLLENVLTRHPYRTYCGFRTNRYTYVQYEGGQEELYDLAQDPFQLANLVRKGEFRRLLVDFRYRVIEGCDPPPPEFRALSPCLISGGRKANTLIGTRFYDVICAGEGSDRVSARGDDDEIFAGVGKDIVHGDAGNDEVTGGDGADRLFGDSGHDTIAAYDGERDLVDCGTGVDGATVDRRDTVRRCETVRRR